ncbi:DUF5722 domain-containing protein [Coraliomargarita sp. W4R53]
MIASPKLRRFFLILLCPILASADTPLKFDLSSQHQLSAELQAEGHVSIVTEGADPYVFTQGLRKGELPVGQDILSFEYISPKGVDHFQVFFGAPRESHAKRGGGLGSAEGWVSYSLNLTEFTEEWRQTGGALRMDFGGEPGVQVQVRNLRFREPTARELELRANLEATKVADQLLNAQLKEYLDADFKSQVTEVLAMANTVQVSGVLARRTGIDRINNAGGAYLFEIMPHQAVTQLQFDGAMAYEPVNEGDFTLQLDRFVEREGARYDRALSKWVLVDREKQLLSHARYPDQFYAVAQHEKAILQSKKGIGGFIVNAPHLSDVEDLQVTSATVNIWITDIMLSEESPDTITHIYNGEPYYFDRAKIQGFDKTFQLTHRKGIVTAAILLIHKASDSRDSEIGRILEHPDCDPSGIYSMPDFSNFESVRYYAAALDFIASRYNREDAKYGRLNHFIMHNEVDAGWVWTNAGEKPALAYFDIYHKSMRLGYAILRRYNPHGEVFISLTHYWAWTSNPKFYHSKELMEYLLTYSQAEGDFQWAIAHHPYPQDLFEPKTWLDEKATFGFDTPLITFKNLEVLDAWVKQARALYHGKELRTVWLSENGTNSRDYSETSLREQAAGFAYTWKKFKHLDALVGFQWHNWYDHPLEGGLLIGLRKLRNEPNDPGGKKPVWYLYEAAGTENEDDVFMPYLDVIGISSWDEVLYRGKIE